MISELVEDHQEPCLPEGVRRRGSVVRVPFVLVLRWSEPKLGFVRGKAERQKARGS